MPVTEEKGPQHTRDQSTDESDPGQGETGPVETTQREAIRGEPTSGGALGDPSELRAYLRGSFGRLDEEDRLMLNDVAPTKDRHRDRDIHNGMGPGKTPVAYGRWPSEAPSIVGSSYYSDNEDVQGAAAAPYTESAGLDLRAANDINAHVKFILRDGHDWVDMEELFIDPAEPSTSSAVECVAEAHTSKRRFLFNTVLRSLAPSECLDSVVRDGTNIVLLIPEGSVKVDHALSMSARMLGMNAQSGR